MRTDWWAFLWQTATGVVVAGGGGRAVPMDRLPAAGSRLNSDGAFVLDVPAVIPGGSRDVTPFLVPWKYGVGIAHGQDVLVAGPITGRVQYEPDTETWSVPCGGLGALLSRKRLLNHDGPRTFTGPSLADLARRILVDTTTRPGGELPVDIPTAGETDPGTGAVHTRTYPADQPIMVGRALEQLSDAEGGPEWEYRPYFPAGDTTRLRFQARLGVPALVTVSTAPHNWARTGTDGVLVSVESGSDGDRVADNYFVPGSTGDAFVMGSSRSTALREAGYPLLDDVDTTHTTVVLQATADAYAAANRSRWSAGSRTLTALVRRSRVLGQVMLGDLVRVPVAGYLGVPDTDHVARVLGLQAVDESTLAVELQVLLSLDAPLPAVPRRVDGRTDEVRELARAVDELTRRRG